MANERTYIIPLRKECAKVANYEKAKKAVKATRAFLIKHMKVEQVLLGKYLHEKLMGRGRKNPPHKVEVKVWKDGEKTKAELVGAPEEKKEEVVEKKGLAKKLAEKVTGKEVKETPQQTEEKKEKAEMLQKPDVKKEKQLVEEKHLDKKAEQKIAKKESFPKSEKPIHEKKK
tara:strand:- start:31162 stop:31677 length:516 start_codon:yes stop_codon:yes gene_type:complete